MRALGAHLWRCLRHSWLIMPRLKRQRRHLRHARSRVGQSDEAMETPPELPVVDLDESADSTAEADESSDDDDEGPEITVSNPTM